MIPGPQLSTFPCPFKIYFIEFSIEYYLISMPCFFPQFLKVNYDSYLIHPYLITYILFIILYYIKNLFYLLHIIIIITQRLIF